MRLELGTEREATWVGETLGVKNVEDGKYRLYMEIRFRVKAQYKR